jgi:outer membrane protein
MAPDERAKKEKELTSRQVDLQYAQQKFNEDATARDRELTQDVMSKVKEAIQQVAKDKSLDLVVQDPVFSAPALDITVDVIKVLQAAQGAGPAATSAKSKKESKQ